MHRMPRSIFYMEEMHYYEIRLHKPKDSIRRQITAGEQHAVEEALHNMGVQWDVVDASQTHTSILGTERIDKEMIRRGVEDCVPGIIVRVKNEADYPDDRT